MIDRYLPKIFTSLALSSLIIRNPGQGLIPSFHNPSLGIDSNVLAVMPLPENAKCLKSKLRTLRGAGYIGNQFLWKQVALPKRTGVLSLIVGLLDRARFVSSLEAKSGCRDDTCLLAVCGACPCGRY